MDIQSNGTYVQTYLYQPSGPAAWTFVVLFALATITHVVLIFWMRSAFFVPMVIGGTIEAFGYYGRVWSSRDPPNFSPYIMQTLLVMTAPPLISASVYMSLGRIVRALDARENALMGPRAVTSLFVFGDIVAFISQLAGAGMLATTSASVRAVGSKVVTAGLFFQLALFIFFIVNIAIFHIRNRRDPTRLSTQPGLANWKSFMYALYAVCILIWTRNLVRIVEYLQGADGFVASHEVFVYLFDAAPMAMVMITFIIFSPGQLMKRAKRAEKFDEAGGGALLQGARELHQMNGMLRPHSQAY